MLQLCTQETRPYKFIDFLTNLDIIIFSEVLYRSLDSPKIFESFIYIQDMGYNGTCDHKHNFYTIFKIFL
jgi:hypothetical protein